MEYSARLWPYPFNIFRVFYSGVIPSPRVTNKELPMNFTRLPALALTAVFGLVFLGCTMSAEDKGHADTLSTAAADYKDWDAFPDFDGWQDGFTVHGRVVRYYMNDIANDNITTLPHGSVIIKEGYTRSHDLKGITFMQRIEGYDPENGDWYWGMMNEQGEVTSGGRMQSCIDCHAGADGGDYSFANDSF